MTEGLSLAELESEQATFLPPRLVMWEACTGYHVEVTNVGSYNGNADGNTYQEGLINVSALNGNFDGDGNGNSLAIL